MPHSPHSTSARVVVLACAALIMARPTGADELWIAPTQQADLGGLGVGSHAVWPVTPAGVVRLAWGVPGDLQTFESAKVVLIPHSPGGAATLNLFICRAESGDPAAGACAGPIAHPFTGVANQLLEVDISEAIAPRVGTAGRTSLAVLAFTTPTTDTDHIVGLRFSYNPRIPSGVATLDANTFSGTQAAPVFVGQFLGNGALLINVAKLGANVFSGVQAAPLFLGTFAGDGLSLTNVAKLTANTFTGTQTIDGGALDLDIREGTITKDGTLFLHDRGGIRNTFLGLDAGRSIGGGVDNTGIGWHALRMNTFNSANTAIGSQALTANVAGGFNTAVGEQTLRDNLGNNNTGIGRIALGNNTVGGRNTGVGGAALAQLTGQSFDNTALGSSAGNSLVTGSRNLYLDSFGALAESDTIRIGRSHTRAFITGVRGSRTGLPHPIPVVIDSAGQLGTLSSSRRVKEDIHDLADASRRLFQLRPVAFRYTQGYEDGTRPIQFGLIAEEVAEVFPELAVRGADGQVETVHYEKLSVLLLNELQRQERELREQAREVRQERDRGTALERELQTVLSRLSAVERRLRANDASPDWTLP